MLTLTSQYPQVSLLLATLGSLSRRTMPIIRWTWISNIMTAHPQGLYHAQLKRNGFTSTGNPSKHQPTTSPSRSTATSQALAIMLTPLLFWPVNQSRVRSTHRNKRWRTDHDLTQSVSNFSLARDARHNRSSCKQSLILPEPIRLSLRQPITLPMHSTWHNDLVHLDWSRRDESWHRE